MYMENGKTKIKHCLIGSLFTIVATIILSIIMSVIARFVPAVTDQVFRIAAYVILAVSAFLGGILSGKGTGSGGIVFGIITAFITIAALKIIELVTTGGISQPGNYMLPALLIFVPTVIGQIIGVNSK